MDFVAAHRSLIPPQSTIIEHAERTADSVVRRGRHVLPHLARLCILSTFLEDAIRMWMQWPEQRDYFNHVWHCGYLFSSFLVLFNLLGQLIPVLLLLLNKQPQLSTTVLALIVLFQGVIYRVIFNLQYLMKSAAVLGGLILLLASCRDDKKSTMFAPLPTLDTTFSNPRTALQLSGRLLLVLMFLTIFVSENEWASLLTWCRLLVGLALIATIMLGYKTSLSALLAAAWLLLVNLLHNRFWQYESRTHHHDYYKFDFFQTMSVIGGLLILVSIGPGGASIDEHKKKW